MRRFSTIAGAALLAATGATAQQDAAIYAPCLTEHAVLDTYTTALENAGWHRLDDAGPRARGLSALGEARMGMIFMQREFASLDESLAFVARAANWSETFIGEAPVFERDGAFATVLARDIGNGMVNLLCMFAGPTLPAIDTVMGDDPLLIPGVAFAINGFEPVPTEQTIVLRVDAIRFRGDEAILAPITGRESVTVSHEFEVPE